MVKLAIFDIDFTLTKKETLLELYKFLIKKKPGVLKKIPKSLIAGLLYIIRVYDLKKSKEIFISIVDCIEENELNLLIKEYYDEILISLIYDDALSMIKSLKEQGYKIILISASCEFYLKELYNIKEVDKIIGTRYELGYNRRKGRIIGENCKGKEKINRLMEYIDQENLKVDFSESYMFSDSLSDAPLFRLVGNPYLINFKGKSNEFKVLNWK